VKKNKIFFDINFFCLGIRSLFLQALWNFEKMQNIGFMFILMKELRRIYTDENEYSLAIKRHLEFFNIHPYMIGIVIGTILKLEEDNKKQVLPDISIISRIKTTMAGPLSAIGDSFFWGLWRPFVSLFIYFILLMYLILNTNFYYENYFIFFLIFLVFIYLLLYNSLHFFLRFYCLKKSYEIGINVISYIQKWKEFNLDRTIRKIGIVLLFFTVILFFKYKNYSILNIIESICVLFLAEFLKNRRKWTTIKLIYAMFMIFFILTFLKVV
jgi:mannose/fructose/N-acetylgalactosamine-specific phosphotransferase system component IID